MAEAIIGRSGVKAGDVVLELGAGTGEIGAFLAALAPGYVGLDNSPAMLEVFRAKTAPADLRLLAADADSTWPLPTSGVRVIFASRVIHLLNPEHVAREATRVCQPGGYVMLGRVSRDADSLKERLRRRRQHLLRETGIQSRQGEAGSRLVIEGLVETGWIDLGRDAVATWSGETSAAQVIAEWRSLSRMGSVEVPDDARAHILDELREWAAREFGDLDRPWAYDERYILETVQLSEHVVHRNA